MSKAAPMIEDLAECRDKTLVGGKAINLGNLIRSGFPVPGGFVITTAAYRSARGGGGGGRLPVALANEIGAAYRKMGSPAVAVRSSATAEDMAEASMAGQYETFLDIVGEEGLLEAVSACWASLDSPRTRTYLKQHEIDLSRVAMAVVVQKLVPADVAGVLFCANPQTGNRREMLIEASWGLGEAVVSGRVQPDVLRLDTETGRVIDAVIADKQVWMKPGSGSRVPGSGEGIPGPGTRNPEPEFEPVDEDRRRIACLRSADVDALWQLGRRASDHFGSPQDIEWAIHQGQPYMLQSRPITTLKSAETYEQILQSTRSQLRDLLNGGRGPWALHNISETLPHPTSLTWSVIQRFMSGSGGFGAMYRMVGFEPSPEVCAQGFLLRIAGRAYMDLSLAAEMFFEGYPFKYDLGELRRNPDASQSPPTIPAGSILKQVRFGRRVAQINRKLQSIAQDFDQKLSEQIIPDFIAWCREEKRRDLTRLPAAELIGLWSAREKKVMDEFAPLSLLPSLICAMAMGELRAFLDENLWDEDPDALMRFLSSGAEADKTVLANAHLREVALGQRPMQQWLEDYGHRAPEEFDLATPRWREQADQLKVMAQRLETSADPLVMHEHRRQQACEKLTELSRRMTLYMGVELDRRAKLVHRYLPYREDGKFYLMLGYDLLRDAALEAARRLEIGDDVFHLTSEELLDALRVGFAPRNVIEQRKIIFEAEARVTLPRVIDKEAIETLGEPEKVDAAGSHAAFAVSSGVASGPARIVRSPQEAGELGTGYVLVCPSTDSGWTPLFVNAAGLILECGGTLSHGAVIAREMSIPAVVLPGATTLFRDGEMISVDGRNGAVTRSDGRVGLAPPTEDKDASRQEDGGASPTLPSAEDPNDTRIPRELVPPVAGEKERWSAKVRNGSALVWGVYLLAAFLLPEKWVWQPSLKAMDYLFWPIVRAVGKPASVAIISGGLAALTMICQWLLTDNCRLLEAKRRAALLMQQAATLPKKSPRAYAMEDLAAAVQMRVALAAFVPLAVLLGPLVMLFYWFPLRVDPSAWNAEPGSSVNVVATIDSDCREAITLDVKAPLAVSDLTPATQQLLPIRERLEQLQRDLRTPSALPVATTQNVKLAAEYAQDLVLADLADYLKRGVPPEKLSWTIQTPEKTPGRFPVTLRAGNQTLTAQVALGDAYPPQPAEIEGKSGSPLQSLKLIYAKPDQRQVFLAPFAWLGKPHWEVGWLITYLVSYIPAMFAVRRLLRVA